MNINTLVNTNSEPYIGMPCTINNWSDCDAAEVVEVKGKSIFIRKMKAKIIKDSAFDGSAEYQYSSWENGPVQEYTLRKNGRYYAKGTSMKAANPLSLGIARTYRDPSF